jgi:hypothetical protein
MSVASRILEFRFDVDEEIQGWILMFATVTAAWLFCLPCFCAGMSCVSCRRCAVWIQQRMPVFYIGMCCFNAVFMFLILTWLPDWSYKDYMQAVLQSLGYLLKHMLNFVSSLVIICAFIFVVCFKDRIALMLGLDHQAMFKCKLRDCLSCFSDARFRPIELNVWKLDDIPSADIFSANHMFVEVFLGYNESMSTRVHNNAGSGCLFKESLQLNFDEDDDEDTLFIFVRSQKVMGVSTLARAEIPADKLKFMVRRGGVASAPVRWDSSAFGEPVSLIPRGRIYLSARSIEDDEYAEYTSMDDLTTC